MPRGRFCRPHGPMGRYVDKAAGIEITPEMARAGARVLAEAYDSFGDGLDEAAAQEAFRAMLSASPLQHALVKPSDLER